MNLTALTLLQGRLIDMAVDCDTRLRHLRAPVAAPCPADDAALWHETTQRSRSALIESLERRRSMAQRALEGIDEGRFGACEHCGQEIDRIRLFVHPDAMSCAACDQASK